MADIQQSLKNEQRQELQMSAKQLQSLKLLNYTQLELLEHLNTLLDSNPVLDRKVRRKLCRLRSPMPNPKKKMKPTTKLRPQARKSGEKNSPCPPVLLTTTPQLRNIGSIPPLPEKICKICCKRNWNSLTIPKT